MKELINAIIADLKAQLEYLQWVDVIDDELILPDGIEFPGVGVKDGAQVYESMPGKKDKQVMNVVVAVYQEISSATPGAAVIGGAVEQGDRFKGVIDIAEAVRTRLNDNFFKDVFGDALYWAHVDQIAGSETLANADGLLIKLKRINVSYRRIL